MKHLFPVLIFCVVLSTSSAFGMYDFCESPADYNTCPQAYDVRTEYWKDIPDYHPDNDNIEYGNMKNKNPVFPAKFRIKKTESTKNKEESN